jgi:hypothetical protein
MKRKQAIKMCFFCFAAVCGIFILTCPAYAAVKGDVNNDGKLGIPEAVYVLKTLAEPAETPNTVEPRANDAAVALSDNEGSMSGVGDMTDILMDMGLDQISGKKRASVTEIITAVLANPFSCGTKTMEGMPIPTTIVFTFNENGDCGVTGAVKVSPVLSGTTLSFTVEFVNVTKGDCVINGKTTASFSNESTQVVISNSFSNLSVCGRTLSGKLTVTYNKTSGKVSIKGDPSESFTIEGSEVTFTLSDFSYSKTEGGASGTLTISDESGSHTYQFSNIQIDTACGLPNNGTLTFEGYTIDFSDTSCDSPVASVTPPVGPTFTVDLQEAKDLLTGRR